MGSRRECTRILDLEGCRVEAITWDGDGPNARVRVAIERRGIRGYECSGCRRRTWQVRDSKPRTRDDLPWAAHPVTVIYLQRRVRCRTCGIRSERVPFADAKARITRRLRQVIGLDCQSMPTSHAAVRHGVSWSKARGPSGRFWPSGTEPVPNGGRGIWAPMKSTAGNAKSSTRCSRISSAAR